jgi:hypothetical protein
VVHWVPHTTSGNIIINLCGDIMTMPNNPATIMRWPLNKTSCTQQANAAIVSMHLLERAGGRTGQGHLQPPHEMTHTTQHQNARAQADTLQ